MNLEQQIIEARAAILKAIKDGSTIRVTKGKGGKPAKVEGFERRMRYIASDETPDRYGDIVRVKGWMLDNFKKSPVFIWGHNYDLPPIGTVPDIRKSKDPFALVSEVEYYERDISEFADTIFRMAELGGIRGVSVGFSPLDSNDPQDPEEREAMGLGKFGLEFTKQDLLELSQVTVPANPNAIALGYTPDEFAVELGTALKPAETRSLFGRDQAQIFVRDAGDYFAAAATPVLRDLSLLPSAPLISLPAGEVAVTMSTDNASATPTVPDFTAEISAAVRSACEQVAKAITEELTSETFRAQIRKSLTDAVDSATVGAAASKAAQAEPESSKPGEQPDAVRTILAAGVHERINSLVSKFGKGKK